MPNRAAAAAGCIRAPALSQPLRSLPRPSRSGSRTECPYSADSDCHGSPYARRPQYQPLCLCTRCHTRAAEPVTEYHQTRMLQYQIRVDCVSSELLPVAPAPSKAASARNAVQHVVHLTTSTLGDAADTGCAVRYCPCFLSNDPNDRNYWSMR